MKPLLHYVAISLLLLGLLTFAATGLMPPEKWDASTQLWHDAKQPLPVRRALFEHRRVIWPIGGASFALAALFGWLGRERK